MITASSRTFTSQDYELRVQKPTDIACVRFSMPSESSNLPGAGPISPD